MRIKIKVQFESDILEKQSISRAVVKKNAIFILKSTPRSNITYSRNSAFVYTKYGIYTTRASK